VIIIKIKKLFLALGLFFIAFLLSGCFLLNNAPIIESLPSTTVKEGDTYTYSVEAIDPNNDTLSFLLITSPEGMTIDPSTGVITWIPTASQIGEHEVTIEVSDGTKSATQPFTITVEKVLLTSIEALPSLVYLEIGETKTISSVTAYYDNNTNIALLLSDCSYESNKPNTATVSSNGIIKGVASCTSYEAATITVSYTDDITTKTDTVTVIVTNPASGGG